MRAVGGFGGGATYGFGDGLEVAEAVGLAVAGHDVVDVDTG